MAEARELPLSTLDAIIVQTLSGEPRRRGCAIVEWSATVAPFALCIEEGSLYPALHRLEECTWIEAEWGLSETKRRLRFDPLTEEGRGRPAVDAAQWRISREALGRVIQPAGEPSRA